MTDAAQNTYLLKGILEWLGFRVRWPLDTDSSAARGMALREGVGRVRHLDLRSLWTQRAVRDHGLKVRKVETRLNAADLGTKRHSRAEHERLVKLAGLRSIDDNLADEVAINLITKEVPDSAAVVRNAALQLVSQTLAALCLEPDAPLSSRHRP